MEHVDPALVRDEHMQVDSRKVSEISRRVGYICTGCLLVIGRMPTNMELRESASGTRYTFACPACKAKKVLVDPYYATVLTQRYKSLSPPYPAEEAEPPV
jgi:hypothetical protein